MLGGNGPHGNVFPTSAHHKYGNGHGIMNLANGATATIADKVGNTMLLMNRRVVEGIITPIISLTQLMA